MIDDEMKFRTFFKYGSNTFIHKYDETTIIIGGVMHGYSILTIPFVTNDNSLC